MLSAAPRSLSAPHTIGSACHFDKKLLFSTASIVIIIIKILMRPCIQLGQLVTLTKSSILNAHRQNNDKAPHILGHLDDADGKDNDDI